MSSGRPPGPRLPRATYRLQVHAGFTFRDAQQVLPYLEQLGISDLYLSPPWQAVPGSTHGYNVTDHARLNGELGGERAFAQLAEEVRARGMGLIVDFVPNHMGIEGGHNPYWEDVLENGQASRYAPFFDIAWQPLKRALGGKVLLPTLGDQYGRVLERGELCVVRDGGRLRLKYFERAFPLSPRTLAPLLDRAADASGLPEDDDEQLELRSIATQGRNLPVSEDGLADADRLVRAREKAVMVRRIAGLLERSVRVQRALDAAIAVLNAPENRDRLDELIQAQNYRLAYWRVATEEINYRRFFDINDLAALRMEDDRVFDWAHALLFRLLAAGQVTGVRLDHTDGLYDPLGYFQKLQAGAARALGVPEPGHEARGPALPLYVLAEKILEPGEALPERWPIAGTTGYDFLAQLGGVFVDGSAAEEFTAIYRRFTGDQVSYGRTLYEAKRLIERGSLASEVNVLAEGLERLAESDRRSRDFTLSSLRSAIREVIACFPVYRSYVREDGSREPGDDGHIRLAVRTARRLNRDIDQSVFDFLGRVLTLEAEDEGLRAAYAEFAMKFQQLTGPVTAKGAEDTSFYRYVRLAALNEVGGDPNLFGTPLGVFHEQTAARARDWPHAMLASSTHDTKRGEDTRARIAVLSELPQTWSAYLSAWSRVARTHERHLDGERAPSLGDEYFFYQNALGAWPLDGNLNGFADRMVAFMHKSAREAKLRTSWGNQDAGYEAALEAFVRAMLADDGFTRGLTELHGRISPHGAQNGLSNVLVKLTAPGVPDTYQGAELWNQALVDPDNRREVHYKRHQKQLDEIQKQHAQDPLKLATDLLTKYADGRVKLLVSWAALRARIQHDALFRNGAYEALDAGEHAVAFARTLGKQVGVTVAPRLTHKLTGGAAPWATGAAWGETTLPLPRPGTYTNVLTGERFKAGKAGLKLAEGLAHFPLALLLREA